MGMVSSLVGHCLNLPLLFLGKNPHCCEFFIPAISIKSTAPEFPKANFGNFLPFLPPLNLDNI